MNQKTLYTTYHFNYLLSAIILRTICTAITLFLIIHYASEQLHLSVICATILFLILIHGNEYIAVYSDRFELKSDAWLKLPGSRSVYRIDEIDQVSGVPRPNKPELSFPEQLKRFLLYGNAHPHTFLVQLNNGSTQACYIGIYYMEIMAVIEQINQQKNNRLQAAHT